MDSLTNRLLWRRSTLLVQCSDCHRSIPDVQACPSGCNHCIPGLDRSHLRRRICHPQRRESFHTMLLMEILIIPPIPYRSYASVSAHPLPLRVRVMQSLMVVRPPRSLRDHRVPRVHLVHALVHPVRAVRGAQDLRHVMRSTSHLVSQNLDSPLWVYAVSGLGYDCFQRHDRDACSSNVTSKDNLYSFTHPASCNIGSIHAA